MPYDAVFAPDPQAWLPLDESERLAEVLRYPKRKQVPAGRLNAHTAIHAAVGTRLAEGHPSATATLRRLLEGGPDRHDAVHAIALGLDGAAVRCAQGEA